MIERFRDARFNSYFQQLFNLLMSTNSSVSFIDPLYIQTSPRAFLNTPPKISVLESKAVILL